MIVVVNRLTVPTDYAERLETAFRQRGDLTGQPGFLAFEFLKRDGVADGCEYVVYTRWADRQSYETWVASDSFSRAHSGVNPRSPVQSQLEIYEVVHNVP